MVIAFFVETGLVVFGILGNITVAMRGSIRPLTFNGYLCNWVPDLASMLLWREVVWLCCRNELQINLYAEPKLFSIFNNCSEISNCYNVNEIKKKTASCQIPHRETTGRKKSTLIDSKAERRSKYTIMWTFILYRQPFTQDFHAAQTSTLEVQVCV